MSDRYNLPADTATLVNDHIAKCKNLSLILDKYPPKHVVEDTKHKGPWLQGLIQGNHIDADLARSAYDRWHRVMSAMNATFFIAFLEWRMVMGLGGESVLETDITLHHLYGLPFVPASALKGLTRAYLTGEIEGYKDENNEEVERIFGSQKRAGTVLFFDAMPTDGKVAFALDIMNPHYSDYYVGKRPPTNDQDPIPVTFLTVTDTTFTFALAPRDASNKKHREDTEKVRMWLLEGLQRYGIGGKTSAGYGYFKKEQLLQEESRQPGTQLQAPTKPTEHIRPQIPQFREGQEIMGLVIAPTEEHRRVAPTETRAFLSFQSFATREVLIVVSAEEAQVWRTGDTRKCVFVREEVHDGCTLLVCQPRVKKDKKK